MSCPYKHPLKGKYNFRVLRSPASEIDENVSKLFTFKEYSKYIYNNNNKAEQISCL